KTRRECVDESDGGTGKAFEDDGGSAGGRDPEDLGRANDDAIKIMVGALGQRGRVRDAFGRKIELVQQGDDPVGRDPVEGSVAAAFAEVLSGAIEIPVARLDKRVWARARQREGSEPSAGREAKSRAQAESTGGCAPEIAVAVFNEAAGRRSAGS